MTGSGQDVVPPRRLFQTIITLPPSVGNSRRCDETDTCSLISLKHFAPLSEHGAVVKLNEGLTSAQLAVWAAGPSCLQSGDPVAWTDVPECSGSSSWKTPSQRWCEIPAGSHPPTRRPVTAAARRAAQELSRFLQHLRADLWETTNTVHSDAPWLFTVLQFNTLSSETWNCVHASSRCARLLSFVLTCDSDFAETINPF